jgi:4-hydroxy-3-polyprenylbenzoate decarboxylase
MKTVAAIRGGLASDLLSRAADVVLKERRKLVLLPRESPFNDIHLDNMLTLSRMGVVMVPPVPAFYNNPKNLDDVINHIIVRALDQFGIDSPNASVWNSLHEMSPLQNQHLPDREDHHGCLE